MRGRAPPREEAEKKEEQRRAKKSTGGGRGGGRTDAVDEQARQDQIEDVEKGSPPHFDDVRDVRIGLRAAAVILFVSDGFKIHQIKLTVCLVVADVPHFSLLL